jgi:hypothetical protein
MLRNELPRLMQCFKTTGKKLRDITEGSSESNFLGYNAM